MKATEVVCTVRSSEFITPTVFELSFETNLPVEYRAGQFISIVIPGAGPGGRDLRRAYSIASHPESRPLQLCIRKVEGGPGTAYLSSLKAGDTFKATVPFGHFIYHHKPRLNACFIATGTGVSPFRSILKSKDYLDAKPPKAWCLFGAQNETEIIYHQEMSKLPHVEWVIALSRPTAGWKGFKGRVTDYLRAHDANFPWLNTGFYLCGNGAMIDEVKKILLEKGVAKENVHQEIYYKPKDDMKEKPSA